MRPKTSCLAFCKLRTTFMRPLQLIIATQGPQHTLLVCHVLMQTQRSTYRLKEHQLSLRNPCNKLLIISDGGYFFPHEVVILSDSLCMLTGHKILTGPPGTASKVIVSDCPSIFSLCFCWRKGGLHRYEHDIVPRLMESV